jgi:AcrR family transcriptional regulator
VQPAQQPLPGRRLPEQRGPLAGEGPADDVLAGRDQRRLGEQVGRAAPRVERAGGREVLGEDADEHPAVPREHDGGAAGRLLGDRRGDDPSHLRRRTGEVEPGGDDRPQPLRAGRLLLEHQVEADEQPLVPVRDEVGDGRLRVRGSQPRGQLAVLLHVPPPLDARRAAHLILRVSCILLVRTDGMHHTAVMPAVKSRRAEHVDATRAALVDSAMAAFADTGYAATSLDDVVRAARVTKGALYHHFPGGKLALFEAVFVEVDRRLTEETAAGIAPDATGWQLVEQGLDAYLRACEDPVVRRVMFQEGPVALGWERWRELDGCAGRELLEGLMVTLVEQGVLRPQPVPVLTRLLFVTLGEAGLTVAAADDPEQARREVMELMLGLLGGLRA